MICLATTTGQNRIMLQSIWSSCCLWQIVQNRKQSEFFVNFNVVNLVPCWFQQNVLHPLGKKKAPCLLEVLYIKSGLLAVRPFVIRAPCALLKNRCILKMELFTQCIGSILLVLVRFKFRNKNVIKLALL